MKKFIVTLAVLFLFAPFLKAQDDDFDDDMGGDLTSKYGESFLPEWGDIALGVNAVPLFNMLKFNDVNATPSFSFLDGNNNIYGKYMIDENRAIRGRFRFGYGSTTGKTLVTDLDDATKQVENSTIAKYTAFGLGVGYEMSRGHGRVQGYYGGELLFLYNKTSTAYEYGNSLANMGTQLTEVNPGGTMSFGANAFIGVEVFIFPKLSIGGEFTWGVAFNSTGEGTTLTKVDGASDVTTKTAGSSGLSFDTGNAGGAVIVLFYF